MNRLGRWKLFSVSLHKVVVDSFGTLFPFFQIERYKLQVSLLVVILFRVIAFSQIHKITYKLKLFLTNSFGQSAYFYSFFILNQNLTSKTKLFIFTHSSLLPISSFLIIRFRRLGTYSHALAIANIWFTSFKRLLLCSGINH